MKLILDLGVLGVTVLMMVTVGMALERRQFSEIWRRKWIIAAVLAGQVMMLPALGFVLSHGLSLSPHLVAGILLLAACPIGDIANFYVLLARGNVALSVTLNALSCVFSVVTMAVVFAIYEHLLGERFIFAVPTPLLVLRLFLMVLVPVLAGMSLRAYQPRRVARYGPVLQKICAVGIALLIVYVLTNRWAQVQAEWRQTLVVALAFIGLALLAGLAFARLLCLNGGDGVTIGATFAVRNVALASAIAVTLLNQVDYAVFAAIYFLAEVPLLLGVVVVRRCFRTRAADEFKNEQSGRRFGGTASL